MLRVALVVSVFVLHAASVPVSLVPDNMAVYNDDFDRDASAPSNWDSPSVDSDNAAATSNNNENLSEDDSNNAGEADAAIGVEGAVDDITSKIKAFMAPLMDKLVFGPADAVSQWVRDARRKLQGQFEKARQNSSTPLGKSISVSSEIPMNGWTFKLPTQFAGYSLNDVATKLTGAIPPENTRTATMEEMMDLLVSDDVQIPESYSFFEKYPQCVTYPWNQFNCGSCWDFSLTGSLGHRICKRAVDAGKSFPKLFRLSTQAVLSCIDDYPAPGGGCQGGRLNAAAAWIAKNQLPLFKNFIYLSGDDMNAHKELCDKAKAAAPLYGPQPGDYTTYSILPSSQRERAIQNAIMRDGPVAAMFKVPEEFMGYRGYGVFKMSADGKFLTGQTTDKQVVHSYHAISIHGWGVLNGVKYWLIENSWGSPYDSMPDGQAQFFRFLRGEDHCGMESLGVYGIKAGSPDNLPTEKAEPTAQPTRPPQEEVQAECASEWSQGYCVSSCNNQNLIYQPNLLQCPNGLKCCKKASTVPQTLCESDYRGATCMNTSQCRAAGRQIKKGLCPGDSSVACCLPPGASAESLAGTGRSPYKFN